MDGLDVIVKDHSVTIVHRGRTIAEFSVLAEDRRCQVYIPVTALEDERVTFGDTINLAPRETLAVDITTYESPLEGTMALPRAVKERAATRQIKPTTVKVRNSTPSNRDTIDTSERDKVLNLVLKSLKANPNQTKAEISAESHRIAKAAKVHVMAVAGVRANLTRGTYGNVKTLLRKV